MFRTILRFRLLVLLALIGTIVYGVYSFRKLPIDAFGLSAEEVETLITIPVESVMNGLKDVILVRSASLPAMSYVSVYFRDGTDIYFARRLVMEKLPDAREKVPRGFTHGKAPRRKGKSSPGLHAGYGTQRHRSGKRPALCYPRREGQIHQCGTQVHLSAVGSQTPHQQWVARPLIMSVGGVEEIVQFGPELAYRIVPDPDRMIAYQVTLEDLLEALEKNNILVGGGFYQSAEGDLVVRGLGRIYSPEDGAFTMNGREVQGNIVVKRIFENTKEVVDRVKRKLREIQEILPEGVRIEHLYDQAYLTEKAVATIQKALLSGMLLVAFVTAFLMGNFRASLIVISSLPLTLLIAFIVMRETGMSGNLMTLGGLAIGIGMFVDSSVVIVENIYRHLTEKKDGLKFSKPLALTLIIALLASLLIAFTFTPVLTYYFLKPGKETYSRIMALIHRVYDRVLETTFRIRVPLIGAVLLSFVLSLFLLTRIGTEFAPELEEGAVLVKAFMDPNVSLEEGKKVAMAIEKEVLKFPEVIKTYSTIGRAEKGEAADVNYIETWIILKPQDEWETFSSREEFNSMLREKLSWLPISIAFTQPIKMRIDELLSGVRADIAIKIFGQDPEVLNLLADRVREITEQIPGAVDVQKEIQAGRLQLRVYPRWEVLERFGITVEEVLNVVKYTLGGAEVGVLQQDTFLFPIVLTLPEHFRGDLSRLRSVPLFERDGKILTFGDVADLRVEPGLFVIRRENNIRFSLVMCNVEGRDIGSFVRELQERISREIDLPKGYFIAYGGQFENQQRAMKRLSVAVPVSIFLIFVLLYLNFNSVRDALVVMLNVPFAIIGGIVALYASGFNLSVPSAIGFIAIFGIATLNGVVLVTYIRQLLENGYDIREAVKKAAILRIRPILITAITTFMGLIPLLIISDIGSEVQKPLATVVVGGIFTSTLLTLVILPAVYEIAYRRFRYA